jgi:hypothetical protein
VNILSHKILLSFASVILQISPAISQPYPQKVASYDTSGLKGYSPLKIKNCTLLRDGIPYRGIGVNYMTMLYRKIEDQKDNTGIAGLQELASHNIPFVRFSVLPLNANEMSAFISNYHTIDRFMDPLVAEAERLNIGLIPSVFFDFRAVPNFFKEPISAWGNESSKTSRFSRGFSQYIAARYKKSSAIWMWEFGNEVNTWADIPYAYREYRISIKNDTPDHYGPADNYSTRQMMTAFKVFRTAIKLGNSSVLVEAGHDLPRNSAFNRIRGLSKIDRVEEFDRVVQIQNAGADLVSMHLYPFSILEKYSARFRDQPLHRARDFIPFADRASSSLCKPLFLGEFGPSASGAGLSEEVLDAEYQDILNGIVSSGIALAAAWVFDLPSSGHNATYTNERAGRLRALEDANRQIGQVMQTRVKPN